MTAFSRGKVAEMLRATKPAAVAEVPEASRITVHAAVSRFAVLYEKIRNAVDYKDDHLIRKAAIVRILKRQLTLESDASVIALQLIRELIAARYLANGVLPESLVADAALVIKKYQAVAETRVGAERHREWLLGVVGAELEELLDDHTQEKILVHFLFEQLGDRITVKGAPSTLSTSRLDETSRRLQVYIACHRSLAKADDEMMSYKLVRAFHTAWMHPEEWLGNPLEIAGHMVGVEVQIRAELTHPLGQKFLHAVKPWATALGILREALVEQPDHGEKLLAHPEDLHAAVARIAERRYQESRGKLRRGTVRAIIYLFITKMLLALALEIPIEGIHTIPLIINIAFPPLLMLFVGLLIRVPGKDNIVRIQLAVDELLSAEGPKGREIRMPKTHGVLGTFFFGIAYFTTYLVSFGLVYRLLQFEPDATWVSSAIFIFFLCIVSFFAFRLRLAAREYVVVERKEKFLTAITDFFSLPILRAGQWLSATVSRVNVFVFLFDFIIETPYKIFLNVLEDWFAFLKEKKEELQ